MGKQADIHEAGYGCCDIATPSRATVIVDDGCDWTKYLNWLAKAKYRIRNGINEAPPARPKVAPVSFKSVKKPRKKGHRVVQQAIGAV
ncbi:hypothetical protein [Yersinia pekkanenii]|uniref:Uncharacterized protein n=1 Tax=Yersinia pekkanenii TaxID=1288385 RepID=A0A0T9QZP6_9GAMM|nr:hypothetical protein [Yersinia pekkanenii]CNI37180.1 Uncharacterised protein [Yersinia pekkanenii]CRY66670.1 Uncharacterised protein [Yersinia pekkanenii]